MRLKNYRDDLLKRLRDPEYAAEYLAQVLAEHDPDAFLIALKDVVEAKGGVGVLATRVGVKRPSLYKILSKKGNPTLATLQEILKLYDFSDSAVLQQQIAGITAVSSRQVVGRPVSMPWNGFCRGIEVTIEFDEEKYVGSGVFLFASVLEKFLGLYVSLNSFSQLIATTQQREEPLKRWPPRTGEQILL